MVEFLCWCCCCSVVVVLFELSVQRYLGEHELLISGLCCRAGKDDPIVFEEPILKEIAERKNKSTAQVRYQKYNSA